MLPVYLPPPHFENASFSVKQFTEYPFRLVCTYGRKQTAMGVLALLRFLTSRKYLFVMQ